MCPKGVCPHGCALFCFLSSYLCLWLPVVFPSRNDSLASPRQREAVRGAAVVLSASGYAASAALAAEVSSAVAAGAAAVLIANDFVGSSAGQPVALSSKKTRAHSLTSLTKLQ